MNAQPNPYKRKTDAPSGTSGKSVASASAARSASPLVWVLLILAIAAAVLFGVQYSNKNNELAELTAKQEETAAELAGLNGEMATLTAEHTETTGALSTTEAALAKMTAQQEETAATLATTEAALAAMTSKQEETAASLATTEDALAKMTAQQKTTADELAEVSKALEETKAQLEKTEATLKSVNDLLNPDEGEATEAPAADEAKVYPAVTINDDYSYTIETETAVVDVALDGLTITSITATVNGIRIVEELTEQFVGLSLPVAEDAVKINDGVFVPEIFAALYALSISPAPAQ